MRSINFSIPGKPITKLRPRFSRIKGKTRTYDSQVEEKRTVKWQIKSRIGKEEPLDGPLHITLTFVFVCPPTRAPKKEFFHTVKPDLDNCIKWILDVGNAILWHDDKQVASITARKIYGIKAETIVEVGQI